MATESARLNLPKIEFSCTCGKKYRVKASKAGAKLKCKRCKVKLRVPRDGNVSMRSRAAILEELGIDPTGAAEAYEAEKAKREAGYHCVRCEAPIQGDDELKESYCEDGLLCEECRETADEASDGDKKAAVASDDVRIEPVKDSLRHAGFHFALYAVGFAGPLGTLTTLGWIAAIAIALPLAFGGAAIVYRLRRATATVYVAKRKRPTENDTDGLPEGSKLHV